MYYIDGKSLPTAKEMADYIVEISLTYIEMDYEEWGKDNGLSFAEYTLTIQEGIELDLEAMENGDCLTFYSTEVWKGDNNENTLPI